MNESTNLESKREGVELTVEECQQVEELAGINYTVKQIAMYFDIKPNLLQKEFDNLESKFRFHYERGRLISRAKIEKKTMKNAEEGNTTAAQIYTKNIIASRLNNLKHELFGI